MEAGETTGAIIAARVFDGQDWRDASLVAWRDGLITEVAPAPRQPPPGCLVLPGDAILAPGFIDTQVNGGGGVLLNHAPTPETVRTMVAAHRRFGTTGLLPTLITDAPAVLRALAGIAAEAALLPGVLGFHLEGPWLNPARKGIHPAEHLRLPEEAELDLVARFGGIGRSLVTLAPERVPAAVLARLRGAGLRLSAGHSEATAGQVEAAREAGLSGVTHLFNAMSQMTAREPGVVGAALGGEGLFCGVICDGLHVAPPSLRAAYRALGPDRLMLVTDAMSTVGAAEPGFTLNGRPIRLAGGALRGPDGTLAGAHLSMLEAVRNAVALMGARVGDALRMASATPARFLGLEGELGAIRPGFRADLVALDAGMRRVLATVVRGGTQPG